MKIGGLFTGKERDAESGLDYFGARYYGSALGRWTSPDWSSAPEPVPYAVLGDPQTLNLYNYVRNNPLARADADGHADPATEIALDLAIVAIRYPGAANAVVGAGTAIAEGGEAIALLPVVALGLLTAQNTSTQDVLVPQNGDRKTGNRKGDDFANTSDTDLRKINEGNKKDPRWLRAKAEMKARGLLGKGSDGDKKKPPQPPKPPEPPKPEPPPPPDPPTPPPPDPKKEPTKP